MAMLQMLLGAGGKLATSTEYLEAGTYSWVCPAGVTSVSAVAIGPGGAGENSGPYGGGGGACAYKNNITVSAGTSYDIYVGVRGLQEGGSETAATASKGFWQGSAYAVQAEPGKNGEHPNYGTGATAASCTGDGSYKGGNGGGGWYNGGKGGGGSGSDGTDGTWGAQGTSYNGGGAGGNGGGGGGGGSNNPNGQTATMWVYDRGGGGRASNQGAYIGGGGGGGGSNPGGHGGGGGGGGNLGTGTGNSSPTNGTYGGSSGGGQGGRWGAGGGACGSVQSHGGQEGGHGAFRIIWPGDTRQFPSTNVTEQ